MANNHVLDWGHGGLLETLATLRQAGIRTAGAGSDETAASAAAVLPLAGGRRLLFFGVGCRDSGIPSEWAAGAQQPGVHLLRDTTAEASALVARIASERLPGDLVVVSIHWGPNWGHAVCARPRTLAHRLIDEAGVDVVHGHSSHHLRAPEGWRGRLVIYGCGDLLTDYEGIERVSDYRGDLGAVWFPTLDDAGSLLDLRLTVTRMERLQLRRAPAADVHALAATLSRTGRELGTAMEVDAEGRLRLRRV